MIPSAWRVYGVFLLVVFIFCTAGSGLDWTVTTIDDGTTAGEGASLALDSGGHPHIAYRGPDGPSPDKGLKYAWHDGAEWHIQTVDPDVGAEDTGHVCLAVDAYDRALISYFDDDPEDLKCAWHDGERWHVQTIDGEGETGLFTSCAIAAAGSFHVAYYVGYVSVGVGGDLHYAVSPGIPRPEGPAALIWPVQAVTVGWQSVGGQEYQVQWSDQPGGGDWHDLYCPLTGTGGFDYVVDSADHVPRRFYRVLFID